MKSFIVFAVVVTCAFALPLDWEDDAPVYGNGLAALLKDRGGMVQMSGRIVGGDPFPIALIPYIVSLMRLGSHRCGASIISATRCLSAAHCTIGIPGNGFVIRAGSASNNAGGMTRTTSNVINHPNYNPETFNNDICVIVLSSGFPNTASINIIAMPAQGAGTAAGVSALVSGWGSTCEGCAGVTNLRAVAIPVVSNAQCNTWYGGGVTAQMLCAGDAAGGRDFCSGDSGGPLSVGNVLHGIAVASTCGRPQRPGIYCRVASFRTWINGHM